jgi:hypothetical protein
LQAKFNVAAALIPAIVKRWSESPRQIPVLEAVFEFGIERMRAGVREESGEAYYPRLALWVDAASGMIINLEMSEPQEDSLPLVLRALQKLIEQIDGVPREIRMRDPQLAMQLRDRLAPLGDAVKVVVRESLPALEEAFSGMAEFKALSGKPQPGLLDVPGMTLDHIIAFAEAAKEFYLAASSSSNLSFAGRAAHEPAAAQDNYHKPSDRLETLTPIRG